MTGACVKCNWVISYKLIVTSSLQTQRGIQTEYNIYCLVYKLGTDGQNIW